jgi:hypothetical protein
MPNIQKGLCWAGALILLAVSNATGLVDDASANTLFIVLPIVAMMSLRGQQSCNARVEQSH